VADRTGYFFNLKGGDPDEDPTFVKQTDKKSKKGEGKYR